MYTQYDFLLLEEKTDRQLREELIEAQQNYDYIQSLYANEEDDEHTFKENTKHISLTIVFMHLKNIENYIRKIENLLKEYEIYRPHVRRYVKRRNARMSRLP